MKTAHRVQIFICLLTLVSLLIGVSGQSSLSLCFGADGHVAVESSSDGRCTSFSEHAPEFLKSQSAVESQSAPDHCGSCVDFPFFSSVAETQKTTISSERFSKQTFAALLPTPAFVLVSVAPHKIVAPTHLPSNTILDSRKTVVLLI